MPLYFFHVIDGQAIPDRSGTELAGIAEARDEAIRTAASILREEGVNFWRGQEWRLTVADETGVSVLTLRFSADVR